MNLYNHSWTRREIEARTGRIEQLGGLRRARLVGGMEDGAETIDLDTGSGLRVVILPDRGLDLSRATYAGAPLTWSGVNGDTHPAHFDASGLGFLRTFAGGLLSTCGLTQVGAPCEDAGEALPLHGLAHHTPAREAAAETVWDGDSCCLRVAGLIEEKSLFGHNLERRREITARLGGNSLTVVDRIRNAGFAPAPHMLLYHCNFGFPLLQEGSRITFPSGKVTPRDPAMPLAGHDTWLAPDPDRTERVYYHDDLRVGPDGLAGVTIESPAFPVGSSKRPLRLHLRWSAGTLPRCVEWHMPGAGAHVLGIEPSNCHVAGRLRARSDNTLLFLAPGEERHYRLEFAIEEL